MGKWDKGQSNAEWEGQREEAQGAMTGIEGKTYDSSKDKDKGKRKQRRYLASL